jgi:hypothetical protein
MSIDGYWNGVPRGPPEPNYPPIAIRNVESPEQACSTRPSCRHYPSPIAGRAQRHNKQESFYAHFGETR